MHECMGFIVWIKVYLRLSEDSYLLSMIDGIPSDSETRVRIWSTWGRIEHVKVFIFAVGELFLFKQCTERFLKAIIFSILGWLFRIHIVVPPTPIYRKKNSRQSILGPTIWASRIFPLLPCLIISASFLTFRIFQLAIDLPTKRGSIHATFFWAYLEELVWLFVVM